ncbi:MAG: VCBS repeat-containing protein [Minicystis sp.]
MDDHPCRNTASFENPDISRAQRSSAQGTNQARPRHAVPGIDVIERRNHVWLDDMLACTSTLSFAPAVAYDAASLAHGVEITDLNGDGKPDLVVPTWHHDLRGGYDFTLVFLNEGDGSFARGVEYARRRSLVAVGDLDGDGKPDLVVAADEPKALIVLLNRGDGTFAAQPGTMLSMVPDTPLQGTVGDVDGDGIPDLLLEHRKQSEHVARQRRRHLRVRARDHDLCRRRSSAGRGSRR